MTPDVFLFKADAPDITLNVLRGSKPATGDVRRLFASVLNEPVKSIEQLGRSTFHFIYSVTSTAHTYILRTRASQQYPAYEFITDQVMYTRYGKEIPVSRVYAADISRTDIPFDYEIMDHIFGWVYDWVNKNDTSEVFEDLGRVVAQLHSIRTKAFGHPDPRTLSGRGMISGTSPTWISFLELHLTDEIYFLLDHHIMSREMGQKVIAVIHTAGEFHVTPVLLHGDVANQNVFTDGKRVTALIDWEDAISGDPVYDLAYYACGCNTHTEWFDPFLKGYTSRRTLPADFDKKFWIYWVRAGIAKAVSQIRWKVGHTDQLKDLKKRIIYGLSRCAAE